MSQNNARKARAKTIVNSKWSEEYHSTQTRAFARSKDLSYRNVVLSMLLHTPLFVNWIQEVHAEEDESHLCDDEDIELICGLRRLISIYWLENYGYDETLEKCIELIWHRILKNSGAGVDAKERQGPWVALKKVLNRSREEVKENEERLAQLERYFWSKITFDLPPFTCQGCGTENDKEPIYKRASLVVSCPADPPPQEAFCSVAEGICHQLQLETPADNARACDNSQKLEEQPAKGTQIISRLPQVLFLRYDHKKVHHDYLKLQYALTIPLIVKKITQESSPSDTSFIPSFFTSMRNFKAVTARTTMTHMLSKATLTFVQSESQIMAGGH
ncbi:uncharacterized protein BDV14DRAFT_12056 [Aspergillus stella-maris]|uniref:uncharacterized protein n=1 Tax=Aspergillus stella-maris TaxID=1810926 RepID=UPI003CCCD2F5